MEEKEVQMKSKEEIEQERMNEERFKSPSMFKKFARILMPSDPYLPPMPKHHRCPKHGGNCKRINRTAGGANYHCRRCGDFFVPAGVRE